MSLCLLKNVVIFVKFQYLDPDPQSGCGSGSRDKINADPCEYGSHRRRMEREAKAKVVATRLWGIFIQFLATLAVLL